MLSTRSRVLELFPALFPLLDFIDVPTRSVLVLSPDFVIGNWGEFFFSCRYSVGLAGSSGFLQV